MRYRVTRLNATDLLLRNPEAEQGIVMREAGDLTWQPHHARHPNGARSILPFCFKLRPEGYTAVYEHLRREREVPTVKDEAGNLIRIGTKVECGEGEPGVVVAFREPDESYGAIVVKWPEHDEPESFTYHGTGWCWEGPNVCDEVRVIPVQINEVD